MYIANSKATIKQVKKKERNITDTLRTWNNIKYPIKTTGVG